jgi:hypothetical protein
MPCEFTPDGAIASETPKSFAARIQKMPPILVIFLAPKALQLQRLRRILWPWIWTLATLGLEVGFRLLPLNLSPQACLDRDT